MGKRYCGFAWEENGVEHVCGGKFGHLIHVCAEDENCEARLPFTAKLARDRAKVGVVREEE